MNKERLQEYNEILSENNVSLEDINNTINELPDVGDMIERFDMTDCSYLFYQNARINLIQEILNLCKNTTICSRMFQQCSKLTTLDLTDFDTSKVTNMDYMFASCTNLTEVNVSNFNTSNVTTLENMFDGCSKLAQIDVSSFDTKNVKSLSMMFRSCNQLKKIDLSTFDMSSCTNLYYLFYGCAGLTDLNLNFDASKINTIGQLLPSAPNLTNLTFMNNLGKGYTSKTNNVSNYKLDLSKTTKLTYESLMDVINKLYDLNLTYDVANGGTLYTQQLVLGANNLAKLTSEELNIVVQKGWVVS